MILHAGLVAMFVKGSWEGALIEGPSGAGKSDLALRCLTHGLQLVADDRVQVFVSNGAVFGRAPGVLSELLEVRGLGIVRQTGRPFVKVSLAIACVRAGELDRLPASRSREILGCPVPSIDLVALEPSAPAKLCRAMEMLGSGAHQDYDAAFP